MEDLLDSGWKYISEGNVHIVLQLANTSHVLRLIKEDGNPTSLIDVLNSTKFVNLIMAPLLQGNSMINQEIIELPKEQISRLSKALQHLRPENRRIQPNTETRAKQLEAWQQLITEYFKVNKLSTLDVREAANYPLFNNAAINRKLSQESLLVVLEAMSASGRAAPVDKSKSTWEVYWHSLDEWGNMVYSWASSNGMNNSVCTLFELREGDTTVGEEFHGLDMSILTKALKSLEAKGKCELIEFDDNQGVKFF